MGFGDRTAYARVDPKRPRGFGMCDYCGFWWQHSQLRKQLEFDGTRLFWLGWLVCKRCYDTPQAQFLTPILPGDPKPLINPRPEYFDFIRTQDGFGLFTLWAPDVGVLRSESQLAQSKATMLEQVATMSLVDTPATAADESATLGAANTAQVIMPNNPARTWAVIFNPAATPIVISTGQAAFSGDPYAVLLGAGGAALTCHAPQIIEGATDDGTGGLPTLITGPITAAGLTPGQSVWVFESPSSNLPPVPVVFP